MNCEHIIEVNTILLLLLYMKSVRHVYEEMFAVLSLTAKGRTNYELREQFFLPEGASQSMAGFKSRPVGSSRGAPSQAGSATTGSSGWSSSTASGPAHRVSSFVSQVC